MTQPSLLDVRLEQKRPHKRVRPTSVTAYAQGRENFKGRKADVLRWLAAYWNRYNESPTSAELADFIQIGWTVSCSHRHAADDGPTAKLLYVRRGISDLQRPSRTIQSTVEVAKAGTRKCRVTGKTCETWRIIERGTR